MPLWDFMCSECGHVIKDVYGHRCDPETVAPVHCKAPMELYLGSGKQSCTAFEPYETANIHPDGKVLKVRSAAELRRLETEFGVKRMDLDMVSVGGKLERRKSNTRRVYSF